MQTLAPLESFVLRNLLDQVRWQATTIAHTARSCRDVGMTELEQQSWLRAHRWAWAKACARAAREMMAVRRLRLRAVEKGRAA